MTNPRLFTILSLTLAVAMAATGCAARGTEGLPEGSISEGGYVGPIYIEATFQREGDKKPKVYLFGSIKAANLFADKREVSETNHKKFIGAGKNRETLIVETNKDVPGLEDRLLRDYKQRHGL